MKKRLLFGFIGLFLLACVLRFFFGPSTPRVIEVLPKLPAISSEKFTGNINPIVKIGDENGNPLCSGYIAAQNYVVTAAHCLDDEGNQILSKKLVTILDAQNNIIASGTPAGINNQVDFGIILGDFRKFKGALRSAFYTNSIIEQKIYLACGYPYGQKELSCVPFIAGGRVFFQVIGIGALVPGMSGGPVIDIEKTEVVAVNSAVTEQGYAIIAPVVGLLGSFGIEN